MPKEYVPMSPEEAADFAHRMAERGASMEEVGDAEEWGEYIRNVLEFERGYIPSAALLRMAELGRGQFQQALFQANLRILPGPERLPSAVRYADLTTGRIISGAEATERLRAAGITVPRTIRYIFPR